MADSARLGVYVDVWVGRSCDDAALGSVERPDNGGRGVSGEVLWGGAGG